MKQFKRFRDKPWLELPVSLVALVILSMLVVACGPAGPQAGVQERVVVETVVVETEVEKEVVVTATPEPGAQRDSVVVAMSGGFVPGDEYRSNHFGLTLYSSHSCL